MSCVTSGVGFIEFQRFDQRRSRRGLNIFDRDVIFMYNERIKAVWNEAMHKTNLRKVGGSVMMAVPPAVLDMLKLAAGSTVAVTVDAGRLIVEPQYRPRYTLEELLAQCDADALITAEDREWLDAPTVGDELI